MNLHTETAAGWDTPAALPVNWYILAGSKEVAGGQLITRNFYGRDFVLYRSRLTGRVSVFHAHCAHMGCHLKHAIPQDDGIRCGLHNRLITSDGVFEMPKGGAGSGLEQPRLTAAEAWQAIFIWIGPVGEETPLPEPEIAAEGAVMARFVGQYTFDNKWYSMVANGFDMEHMQAVHGRALREDPVYERAVSGGFKVTYLTRVVGTGLSDRIVKWLSGDHIRASITAFGGSLMLVDSRVHKHSFVILSMSPRRGGGTVVRAIVGAKGKASRPLDAMRLRITAWLFKKFLEADFSVLEGLDWRPPDPALTKTDAYSQNLYHYFCEQREACNE